MLFSIIMIPNCICKFGPSCVSRRPTAAGSEWMLTGNTKIAVVAPVRLPIRF